MDDTCTEIQSNVWFDHDRPDYREDKIRFCIQADLSFIGRSKAKPYTDTDSRQRGKRRNDNVIIRVVHTAEKWYRQSATLSMLRWVLSFAVAKQTNEANEEWCEFHSVLSELPLKLDSQEPLPFKRYVDLYTYRPSLLIMDEDTGEQPEGTFERVRHDFRSMFDRFYPDDRETRWKQFVQENTTVQRILLIFSEWTIRVIISWWDTEAWRYDELFILSDERMIS